MHDRYAYRPPGQDAGFAGPLDSRLSGTGLLADDLWLMAHDERTGRALLSVRPLGLGVAGGLLAELMTGPHPAIQMRPDGLLEIRPEVWPRTVKAHPLLTCMAAEPQLLPVRDWLLFLARTAAGEVGARLERAGYVTRTRRRVPGRPPRLVPADRDWAFAPITRATAALRRPSGPYGLILAGLAVACGLGYRLELYLPGAGPAAEAAADGLPGDLQQLITWTQTAVSAAVLSRT
jgi:hypothetical protein